MVTVSGNSMEFELCPEGTYNGVCTEVVDMGMQDGAYGMKRRIRIAFEVDEAMKNGTRHVLSQTFNATIGKRSALREALEGWRGKAFSKEEEDAFVLDNLLGKPVMVSVIHNESNDRTYANIKNLSRLPKGMHPLERDNALILCDLEADGWEDMAACLPDWLKDKVHEGHRNLLEDRKQQEAYQAAKTDSTKEDIDDDIPF